MKKNKTIIGKIKTIKVDEKNWAKIMNNRVALKCDSNNEVITKYHNIIQKFKLAGELRGKNEKINK